MPSARASRRRLRSGALNNSCSVFYPAWGARGCSSGGRAPDSKSGCRGFKSLHPHSFCLFSLLSSSLRGHGGDQSRRRRQVPCVPQLSRAVRGRSGGRGGDVGRVTRRPRFPTHRAQEIIKSVLQERFQGMAYDHDKITDLSRAAADEIKLKIKGAASAGGPRCQGPHPRAAAAGLELPRYKIMAQILVGDQRGEGAVCVRARRGLACGVPHARPQPGLPLLLGQEHRRLRERDFPDGAPGCAAGTTPSSRRNPRRPRRRKICSSPPPCLLCTTTELLGYGVSCDCACTGRPHASQPRALGRALYRRPYVDRLRAWRQCPSAVSPSSLRRLPRSPQLPAPSHSSPPRLGHHALPNPLMQPETPYSAPAAVSACALCSTRAKTSSRSISPTAKSVIPAAAPLSSR